MTIDEARLQRMTANGDAPDKVAREAVADGANDIQVIAVLRKLFALDLMGAKRVLIAISSGKTLEEHEASLAEPLAEVIRSTDP